MSTGQDDTRQTMQRVRVGVTGLAIVLLLIALASALFHSASLRPGDAAANQVAMNTVALSNVSAPMSDIAVAPVEAQNQVAAPATPAAPAARP